MRVILNQNIRLGVMIIQPINDFRDKCIVPINSESFKMMGFRWVWSLLDGFKELEVGVEGLR